jgi:hypothetical protein
MSRSGRRQGLKKALEAPDQVRRLLLWIWCSSFVLLLVIFSTLLLIEYIEGDIYRAALKETNALYAPFVGVMLTYYFSRSESGQQRENTTTAAGIGVFSTLLFNALALSYVAPLLFGIGTVDAALEMMRANVLSWFVAPALGFYFAKDSTSVKRL